MFTSAIRLLLATLCAAPLARAVTPIDIKGSEFINSETGDRFQLLGIAYQPGGQSGYSPENKLDPLSDGDVCLRDAALMQRLGVNAIRVYNLDPLLNHDLCASIFNEVGIYMLIDVNAPQESINNKLPWTSYHVDYLRRTFGIVEAFKNYPNTLLFFSGNEIINDEKTGSITPPYIRAVTRDLKNYIKNHSDRHIPVGYSAADVRPILVDTWNYVQCTTTGDESDPSRVDIFALNSYSWCGDSSFETSSYDTLVDDLAKTSVPVFFSEYGCNKPSPRIFTEVPAIYGPQMTGVMSGGMVYEFSQETQDYGLVTINKDGSAELLVDFDTLQEQFSSLDTAKLQSIAASKSAAAAPPKCAPDLITSDTFNNNFTIPDVPPGAQDLIDNGIKNPNNGKIIAVEDTKVPQDVKASDGTLITNLAIRPLGSDESNTPSPSGTSEAPSSETSEGAAAPVRGSWSGVAAAGFVGAGVLALM